MTGETGETLPPALRLVGICRGYSRTSSINTTKAALEVTVTNLPPLPGRGPLGHPAAQRCGARPEVRLDGLSQDNTVRVELRAYVDRVEIAVTLHCASYSTIVTRAARSTRR
jgi:hypothetical protein